MGPAGADGAPGVVVGDLVGEVVADLTARVEELPGGWFAVGGLLVLLVVLVRAARRRRRPRRRGPRRADPSPGELWFARVPFSDGTGAKDRPVLVLEVVGRELVVAQLTSQDKAHRDDHVRAPRTVTGLRRDGWLELRRRTIPRGALRRRAGDLGVAGGVWFESELEKARATAGRPTDPWPTRPR